MGTVRQHPRSPERSPTFAHFAREIDARRYCCPEPLNVRMDALLAVDGTDRILILTGRGGSGKSAALRELARRALATGRPVVDLDARAHDVVDALQRLVGAAPHLVIVVEVEALGGGIAALGRALEDLHEDTRVAVAGRVQPVRWLPEALDLLAQRHRLRPLTHGEAQDVLARHEVPGEAREVITDWAGGLPLALVVGARVWQTVEGDGGDPEAALRREAGDDLAAHLADAALDAVNPDVLAVLSLAHSVDEALLADLFPGRSEEILARLRATTVVEPAGNRLVLHPALADVVSERLMLEAPLRASGAVLRIAAHEHARAVAGESAALSRLATLVSDPALRAGLGSPSRAGYYADRWRPGDADAVRSAVESRVPGAWSVVGPWCGAEARVVRRAGGLPVAIVAALPFESALGLPGPRRQLVGRVVDLLGPQLPEGGTVLTPVQMTFAEEDAEEVAAVRNAAALAQCGVANPTRDVVNLIGDDPAERAVLLAYGYQPVPELGRTVAGLEVSTWMADVGPGGLAGLLLAAVTAEHAGAPAVDVEGDVVLSALESFFSDPDLAALGVAAAGLPVAESGERVRAWLRGRIDVALAGEPALRDLIVARYLTAGATHESAMRTLFLSRATYFRRLRRARDLVSS